MPVTRREFFAATACFASSVALSGNSWAEALLTGSPEEYIDLLTGGSNRMAFTPATRYRPYTSKVSTAADSATWVQVDLGRSTSIDAIELYPTFNLGQAKREGYGFPMRFKIEASDDPEWKTAWVITDHTDADFADPGDLISNFPASQHRSARYVRVTATRLRHALKEVDCTTGVETLSGNYSMALSKIGVLSNGVDVAERQPVTADTQYGNIKTVGQLTRPPRPMGETVITDNPGNMTTPSQWTSIPYSVAVPKKGVTLHGGVLQQAMENNVAYLLDSFSVDHMLLPFRERAHKPANPGNRPQDPFWDIGLPGSNAGRFLMGAANTLRWMHQPELRNRMEAVIDGIAGCRDSDGYIMGYAEDNIFYFERGAYTRAWVTHGLIEAGYTGNSKAFDLLRGYYNWFDTRPYMSKLLRGAQQGNQGMIANTRMYFTPVGRPEDIQVIQRYFQENYWLKGLAAQDEAMIWQYPYDRPHCYLLTDLEAYMDLYRATGDPKYLNAVQGAWELYRRNWEHIGGSSAIKEFLVDPPRSYHLHQNKVGELCGTSFWVFLSQRFHGLEPEQEKYVNEIEKSIYNVALANQGGTKGLRSFTKLEGTKWKASCVNTCCEGQGTRLIGSLPEHIYSIAPDGLYINLFAASTIEWMQGENPMQLKTATEFPFANHVQLTFSTRSPVESKLRLRIPTWAAKKMAVQVNGKHFATGTPGSYLALHRTWKDGDTIAFVLPAELTVTEYTGVDQIPGKKRYAIEYGPILLAATGVPNPELKLPAGSSADRLPAMLQATPGQPLHFTVDNHPGITYKPYWLIDEETFTCLPPVDTASAT